MILPRKLNVEINNTIIENVNEFKYLGCVIDENTKFSGHHKYLISKIAKKLIYCIEYWKIQVLGLS